MMEILSDLASCKPLKLSLTPAERSLVFKRVTHIRCSMGPSYRVSLGAFQPIVVAEPPPRCQFFCFWLEEE